MIRVLSEDRIYFQLLNDYRSLMMIVGLFTFWLLFEHSLIVCGLLGYAYSHTIWWWFSKMIIDGLFELSGFMMLGLDLNNHLKCEFIDNLVFMNWLLMPWEEEDRCLLTVICWVSGNYFMRILYVSDYSMRIRHKWWLLYY